jgi:hypothetical protein
MPRDFVTIYTFSYPHQAMVIVSRLEAEQIPHRLLDALTVQSDPLLSNAIGGVKLQVEAAYIEEAKEILLGSNLLLQLEVETLGRFREWSDSVFLLNAIKTVEFRLLAVSGFVACFLLLILYFFLES